MAIVSRTSTFSAFTNLVDNVNRVQNNVFKAQDQLSSGLKTDNFAGLEGQAEQFVFLEARVQKLQQYQENNAVNLSRLEATKQSLQQSIEITDDMEDLITLRRNGALEDNINFEQQMRSFIRGLADEINTTFEGKFIFGGTRTNIPPVIVEPEVPRPFETGVPDDSYYQGSQEDVILRVDDGRELTSRVRGDAEAFQEIFAAAYQSLEAAIADDEENVANSLDLLQQGLDKLIALETGVNSDIVTINGIVSRQNALQLRLQGTAEQLSNTNVLEVSTKLAVDQTTLQATFQAFSVIQSLRLADFL